MINNSGKFSKSASSETFTVPLLNGRSYVKYSLLILFWVVCLLWFWSWWLQPEHVSSLPRYLVVTAALAWLCLLPIYYLSIFIRARVPVKNSEMASSSKIAMVVTKASSEPFEIVQQTLEAMLAQDIPHDNWLADEDPAPETLKWCAENNVKVSTRKGIDAYHQKSWPRRTRCKEGNLAYFYDQFGYKEYDFVSQLDADHVPQPGYLKNMMAPFADPRVGYVSAPSICSKNADSSWAARSRLHTEALFHGTLQAGYSNGWAPMCIGSHYAVRTTALKEIGGLGPELAEDHSTSMMMNAAGWRGVHAFDAIAIGDGPETFPDMATQEFQWARSLVTILLNYTPSHISVLPWRLKFQFLFCQLIYPLIGMFMLGTFLLPIYALVFDVTYADISFPIFLLHFLPMTFVLILLASSLKYDGYLRPVDAKIVSWEKAFFHIAQWPWMLAGSVVAIWDRFTAGFVDFRVTPKGIKKDQSLPVRIILPYAFLSFASAIPVIVIDNVNQASGFYIFAAINAFMYAMLLITIVGAYYKEAYRLSFGGITRLIIPTSLSVSTLILALSLFPYRAIEGLDSLSNGVDALKFTEVKYAISGAGIENSKVVRLKFEWGASNNKKGD